jgi:hypothetical protein
MREDHNGVSSWLQRPSDIAPVALGPLVLISRWAATHIAAVDVQPISRKANRYRMAYEGAADREISLAKTQWESAITTGGRPSDEESDPAVAFSIEPFPGQQTR